MSFCYRVRSHRPELVETCLILKSLVKMASQRSFRNSYFFSHYTNSRLLSFLTKWHTWAYSSSLFLEEYLQHTLFSVDICFPLKQWEHLKLTLTSSLNLQSHMLDMTSFDNHLFELLQNTSIILSFLKSTSISLYSWTSLHQHVIKMFWF